MQEIDKDTARYITTDQAVLAIQTVNTALKIYGELNTFGTQLGELALNQAHPTLDQEKVTS